MKRGLFFLLIFALILRLYFAFIYPPFPVGADAQDYDALGWNLAAGNGFVFEKGKPELARAPGYPFFLAAIYKIFGHSYNHVRAFQVLFSIFTLLLIFLLAKDNFGEETAFYSLLIASFYPPFLSYNGLLFVEGLFAFFIVLSTYLFLYGIRKKRRWIYTLLGVVSGYAVLLRVEFILVLLIFLALAVIYSRGDLKKIIYVILIVSLVIAPWIIRNYKVSGRFVLVLSQLGSTLWVSSYKGEWLVWHNEDPYYSGLIKGLSEVEKDNLLWKEGIKNIEENPFRYFRVCFKFLWRFWIGGHSNTFYGLHDSLKNYFLAGSYGKAIIKTFFLIFNTTLIILGGYGMLSAIKKLRDKKRELSFLISPIFVIMIIHFFLFGVVRYQVPIMPLIIIFAAFGLLSLQHKKLYDAKNELGLIK